MRRVALFFAMILTAALPQLAFQKPKAAEQKKEAKLTEEEKEMLQDRELLENMELLQSLDKIQYLELFTDEDRKSEEKPVIPANNKTKREI